MLNQLDVFFFIGTGKCKVGRSGVWTTFIWEEEPFLSTWSISCGCFVITRWLLLYQPLCFSSMWELFEGSLHLQSRKYRFLSLNFKNFVPWPKLKLCLYRIRKDDYWLCNQRVSGTQRINCAEIGNLKLGHMLTITQYIWLHWSLREVWSLRAPLTSPKIFKMTQLNAS